MTTDADIARSIELKPIEDIAGTLRIPPRHVISYGPHTAKVNSALLKDLKHVKDGKLIIVTAMTPTHAGEGNTTPTIGFVQGVKVLNTHVIARIRQPSLGPF